MGIEEGREKGAPINLGRTIISLMIWINKETNNIIMQ